MDDKCNKVFYNANKYSDEEDSDLRAFLNFVSTNQATDDFTNQLQKKVTDIKKDEYYRADAYGKNSRNYGTFP